MRLWIFMDVRQDRKILFVGIVIAATGIIWLILNMSYSPPPQATLFPTIDKEEVAELTNNAVTNEDHGIRLEFVRSSEGYFTGGIAPVNAEGEGPAPLPNALLLSSTKADVYHHRILICGPDGICIDDSQGGGPIFAATDDKSNDKSADNPAIAPDAKEDYQTIFYQFYPLNEVGWNLGDVVNIWILISNAAKDGSPIGESQWVSLGEVTIAQCNSLEWCPAT